MITLRPLLPASVAVATPLSFFQWKGPSRGLPPDVDLFIIQEEVRNVPITMTSLGPGNASYRISSIRSAQIRFYRGSGTNNLHAGRVSGLHTVRTMDVEMQSDYLSLALCCGHEPTNRIQFRYPNTAWTWGAGAGVGLGKVLFQLRTIASSRSQQTYRDQHLLNIKPSTRDIY